MIDLPKTFTQFNETERDSNFAGIHCSLGKHVEKLSCSRTQYRESDGGRSIITSKLFIHTESHQNCVDIVHELSRDIDIRGTA